MGRVNILGRTLAPTQASIKQILRMEKACIDGQTEESTMVCGSTVNNTVKDISPQQMAQKEKATGKMDNVLIGSTEKNKSLSFLH